MRMNRQFRERKVEGRQTYSFRGIAWERNISQKLEELRGVDEGVARIYRILIEIQNISKKDSNFWVDGQIKEGILPDI